MGLVCMKASASQMLPLACELCTAASRERERNGCSVEPMQQLLPSRIRQPCPLSILHVELTQFLDSGCRVARTHVTLQNAAQW